MTITTKTASRPVAPVSLRNNPGRVAITSCGTRVRFTRVDHYQVFDRLTQEWHCITGSELFNLGFPAVWAARKDLA